MTMRRFGDLMVSTGEFKDANGRPAKRWHKVGVAMRDTKTGAFSLKLDLVPTAPEWSGWIAIRNTDPEVRP